MPFQPPTRPHSANPGMNPSIFPRTVSSSNVYKHDQKQQKSSSMSSFGKSNEEWDDAWDSSSDKEDELPSSGLNNVRISGEPMTKSKTVPIPLNSNAKGYSNGNGSAGAISMSDEKESVVVGSWASTSYHHISPPSPIKTLRPNLTTSKTFTEGTMPPPPGTSSNVHSHPHSGPSGSRLPPGGAWEIVETAEIPEDELDDENEMPPIMGKEAVKDDVEDILKDPLQLLSNLSLYAPQTPGSSDPLSTSSFPFLTPTSSYPQTPNSATSPHSPEQPPLASGSYSAIPTTPRLRKEGSSLGRQRSVRTERKREKFARALRGRDGSGSVELGELRKLAWNGVPEEVRGVVWMLLLNYLPLPSQPRLTTLNRKRKEYTQLVDQYFGRGLSVLDQQIWHQIEIDVPRTRPGVPLWACITTQRSLERILYVWAIRHPASGYVQGINDLVTPFFQVFLSAYIDTDPELFDVAHLPTHVLQAIEADTFWCLTKLLDGIQDHYISQQPGIQRLVKRMGDLVKRIDAPLAAHFEDQGVEFMQFAFRWMNCLLMREISVKCTIRMWDTYLAEGADAFSKFHLYVCSALLVKYSERLREMDFQEMIMFLQCLPTHSWTDHDIELLLSEAYVLKMVWAGAENHFANLPIGNQGQFGMLGR
ncbi:uncharacterized protein I303_100674 [Kwoniella dejecticola CBS 10117]|uniref:Tbc1 domain family protein n=1 Tax=Kwoniella dejecticola CBS 10117 TaxID=1296121 RepID=A0A1A6AFM6_9TREE|nr:tbc1 domain family protein [Kwoniella dejecticola CBS 10117]OBR88861.1 tbc1 domain family protein [Kwoniella dejecticola CBS 10117]